MQNEAQVTRSMWQSIRWYLSGRLSILSILLILSIDVFTSPYAPSWRTLTATAQARSRRRQLKA